MANPEERSEAIQFYATARGISIGDSQVLGFGQDGAVWFSSRETAVKLLERDRTYFNERDAYLRLQEENIKSLGVFAVPSLVDYDDALRIVEMAIVTPPYLLDFGKVYVDRDSPYTPEQKEESLEECRELFEADDWALIEDALLDLRLLGIEYLDIKPANIRVR